MNGIETEHSALRLAQYLKEFVRHRTPPVSDIDKYEAVLWFADIPQEADCRSGAWTDDWEQGDAWLEVDKQEFEPAPKLPEIVIPWVDEQAFKRATPEIPPLHVGISVPDDEAEFAEGGTPPVVERALVDHPEVQAAYDEYRPSWDAWSMEYRRREAIQEIYAELFRLRTQVLKQGEVVEVVLGLGLLHWRTETALIRRHVVVASVELTFDPDKGVIRIEPPGEGAQLRIEDEMLDANFRPDPAHYEAVREQLDEIGDDLWDMARMTSALRTWTQALSADAQWSPEIRAQSREVSGPAVRFAPALILRKRPQIGMLRVYDALIDQLSGDSPKIPNSWGGLVEDGGFGGSDPNETSTVQSPEDRPSEIYFPLSTNREQRQIIEALNRQRGVLVQGPPGTGKSHTIANLICHLLATGQRVLVTAETAQALRVVKDKLPDELQALCVSLLGQGGDAFSELNRSVQGITTKQASYTQGTSDHRISEAEDELEDMRRRLARTDSELRSLRTDETEPLSIANGTYSGTASKIAQRVARERTQYGWLRLPNEANSELPLSGEVMTDWLDILRRYSKEQISQSQLRIPTSGDLPTPGEFTTAVASENKEASAVAEHEALRSHPAYPSLSVLTPDLRKEIADRLREIESRRRTAVLERNEWVQTSVRDWIAGNQARWNTIIDSSRELLTNVESLSKRLGNRVVRLPASRDRGKVRSDAEVVISHLKSGGKWKRFGLVTPQKLKGREYLKDEVFVDSVGASDSGRLQAVCDYLDTESARDKLREKWDGVGAEPLPDDLRQALAVAKEQLSALEDGRDYASACNDLARTMATASPPVPVPDWLNGEAGKWLELIEAADIEDRHRRATQTVDSAAGALVELRGLHDAHPVVAVLVDAVNQRNVSAYSEHYEQIAFVETLRAEQQRRAEIERILAETVPGLASSVAETVEDAIWSDRFGAWEAAWCWAVVDRWLQKRSDFTYHQELQQRRHDAEKKIADLLARVAAFRAWKHFFARLSERQQAALKGWREAVRAMGKGTGRSARLADLRRQARAYMDECRDAIPVWIMPRYLVAEMVNPEPECYDLVIVDEASQLGIDSSFLFYISKKMVVVGDDQQISPYGIGIPDDAIADLQRRYLDGIPHHHAFSPQSSLYGNAKIRFSGRNIVLQEHFRCMPEIIQFSNDLCYAPNGTPLDPLRTYPTNRLEPLILRHVADGYRTGGNQNAQNPPEADAIVEQITECIADSHYTKKTMGVISLQGEAQAKLIERKLLECVDLEQVEERRLICGDAYAFQGDERDIIFLSMVAAERDENGQPQRIGTLANESAKQRFNVAASRARDQLWLFHTAVRDSLSDKCLRRKLLEYMLDPSRRITEEQDQRFDSDFERDVFRRITERGFHVRTQVGVGDTTNHRYRIDLVVEGMQGRLAVECDGDQWHGPERYDQDMARQRDLERAGWQFVRIRGGDFYRDPDKAMEPVWVELDRLEITPGGIGMAAAELSQPPSPEVSEGNASVSSASPEISLGGTEPGVSVSQGVEASIQPTRQGVFEFDAEGPLALQPMQSPLRVDDSSAYKTKEREYDTAELDWYDVKGFFRSHGCPTSGGTEMRWYEESWGTIMRSGLASTSRFEKDEHGEIIIKLRAVCLLTMYLGMYQQGGHMEGYFDDHPWGLSGYLEELGIDKKKILELLNINKKKVVEVEDVLVPRLADVRDIVGEDYLDNLDDLLDDLDLDDPDSVDWERLADLVEWEMIEEAVLKLVRDENSSIYNVLENHYGGKNLLFVSIWNSRLPFHESEPAIDVLNDVSSDFSDEITGQKLMMWSYVEDGMCHWSI